MEITHTSHNIFFFRLLNENFFLRIYIISNLHTVFFIPVTTLEKDTLIFWSHESWMKQKAFNIRQVIIYKSCTFVNGRNWYISGPSRCIIFFAPSMCACCDHRTGKYREMSASYAVSFGLPRNESIALWVPG